VEAARALSARRARACFVYPAAELATLLATVRAAGLEPKRMRAVHPTLDAPARLVLVEVLAGKPGGLVVEAPLVERAGAAYTPEMREILGIDAEASLTPRRATGRG
jgi:tRNA1Val (adenine37-N6)-methyltransferase